MTARGWITIAILSLLALGGAIGGAYHEGRVAEQHDARVQIRDDSLKHNADSLRMTATALVEQHATTVAAVHKDAVVRQARATARAAVRIANDSQVVVVTPVRDSSGTVIDSIGTTVNTPKEVVAEIRASDVALAQDSVAMASQAAELQTLYRRDTLHVEREHLLEEQLADAKPPRCGRRCGFAAGAAVVLAATHPAQVIKAVGWLARLIHK